MVAIASAAVPLAAFFDRSSHSWTKDQLPETPLFILHKIHSTMKKSNEDTQERQVDGSQADAPSKKQRREMDNDKSSRVDESRHACGGATYKAAAQSSHQQHETASINKRFPMDNGWYQGSAEPHPSKTLAEIKKHDSFQSRHRKRPRSMLSMPQDNSVSRFPNNGTSASLPPRTIYQEKGKFPVISGDASLRPSNSGYSVPHHQILPPSGHLHDNRPSEKDSADSTPAGQSRPCEKLGYGGYHYREHLPPVIDEGSSLSRKLIHREPSTRNTGTLFSNR